MNILLLNDTLRLDNEGAADIIKADYQQNGNICDATDIHAFLDDATVNAIRRKLAKGNTNNQRLLKRAVKKLMSFLTAYSYQEVVALSPVGAALLSCYRQTYIQHEICLSYRPLNQNDAALAVSFMCDKLYLADIAGVAHPTAEILQTEYPINKEKFVPKDRDLARENVSLPKDIPLILLRTTSYTSDDIKGMITALRSKSLMPIYIVILCAKYGGLYSELTEAFSPDDTRIVYYTGLMPDYFAAADVYVTSTHSLSCVEAQHVGTQVLILPPNEQPSKHSIFAKQKHHQSADVRYQNFADTILATLSTTQKEMRI